MALAALDPAEARERAAALQSWDCDGLSLSRDLDFPDFAAAFAFLTRVALLAERMNHHPDWSQSWGRVQLRLSTHSAGGLTELDFALAARIDVLAAPAPTQPAPGG